MFFAESVAQVQTELPGLITTSAMSVAIIQAMKNSNQPWLRFINQHSSNINRLAGFIMAGLSALSLHYKYDVHDGSLLITGLTPWAVAQAAYHVAFDGGQSWSFNWIIYQLIKGRAADVAAVAEHATTVPLPVAPPGVVAEGIERATEHPKG